MKRATRILSYVYLGSTSLVFANGAMAQDAPPASVPPAAQSDASATTPAPGVTAQTESPTTSDVDTMGDIVVTAQRREERLQNVPIAISAFSGAQLERSGVASSIQLTQVTPGLNFTQSSYSPQPTIRGIGTRGVTAGDESVVPVYIDGVYQPFLASTALELNNVERVEVLRGPQGALLGRNSTGGAINIITLTPGPGATAKGSISYGTFNEVEARAYASVGNDVIAADIALASRTDDGYIRDITRGGKRGWTQTLALRSKLLVRPTDSLEFIAAYSRTRTSDTIAPSGQPLDGNTIARRFDPTVPLPTGPYQSLGTGGIYHFEQDTVSLTGRLDLDAFSVTSITAYDQSSTVNPTDSDVTAFAAGFSTVANYERSVVQELYATSAGAGAFKWTLGTTLFFQTAGTDPTANTIRSLAGTTSTTSVFSRGTTDSIALYAQGSYDLTEQMSLTVGGRYTTEKKNFFALNNLSGATITGSARWNKFTPTATLQYRFSDDANLYAKFGKGFKAGVYPSSTFGNVPADPEDVTQYELGTKIAFAPWVRTNFSAYYSDYKNIQVNVRDPVTLISGLQNAAAAEIYGVEGEVFVTPVKALNLRAGFSLLRGRYLDYKNAVVVFPTLGTVNGVPNVPLGGNTSAFIDASGNNIIRTPFVTLNGGFDYGWNLGGGKMTIAANAYYAGRAYRDANNTVFDEPRTIVNAELGWRSPDDRYRVTLWSENLLDRTYTLYKLTSTNATSAVYAKPRTVGIRLGFDLGR